MGWMNGVACILYAQVVFLMVAIFESGILILGKIVDWAFFLLKLSVV